MASPCRESVPAVHRAKERLAALAVMGPFGAVKEQSSGLHAQTMPERGRPARWKMAIVTSIAIYTLLVVLIPLFRPVTSGQPNSIAVIPVIVVAVPDVGKIPLLTWLLREWLAPRPRVVKQPSDEPAGRRRGALIHIRSAV
jgi:antibiotic biosynthesis monooxygenase (ABM) superfamily enzyme